MNRFLNKYFYLKNKFHLLIDENINYWWISPQEQGGIRKII